MNEHKTPRLLDLYSEDLMDAYKRWVVYGRVAHDKVLEMEASQHLLETARDVWKARHDRLFKQNALLTLDLASLYTKLAEAKRGVSTLQCAIATAARMLQPGCTPDE